MVEEGMPGVATIPAGVPFAEALAAGLLAEAATAPHALADALILLPTRRACRLLAEALLRRSSSQALLLPRIQPLGEIDADEVLLDSALEGALPAAIAPLRRQLLLARLFERSGWPMIHALRLAEELAALLDELQTERVPLDALARLIPEQLAEHWQRNRDVLAVIAEAWPRLLAEERALDPAERRHRLLTELAAQWRAGPPEQRIVAAGSTGSIPATRALLRVIASLARGTVVLPGLDQDMGEPSWRVLTPAHPQFGLKQLLAALEVERLAVREWPAPGVAGSDPARARLLGEAMRPAAAITAWQDLTSPPAAATQGLAIEQHPDLSAEALALALRMRGALEVPGRTAALATRDRQLARRVAAELRRWGIEVDDSAGTPLDQTPPGAFLLLTARLVIDGVTPVALLAALKHPFARHGQDAGALREQARALELACLRGPRLAGGFGGILVELRRAYGRAANDQRRQQRLGSLIGFVERLQNAARPFGELAAASAVELGALLRAHLAFAETLALPEPGAASPLWAREAGEGAAALFADLLDAADLEHRIAPAAYPAVLARLMAARPVRSRAPKHPRLHIWGQLETRLQHADLLLLGGLNEGTWPALADPGPWLSGSMRATLGLAAVERRIGLAAHDFVQAACARQVVLSRAEKDAQGNPTVPCRWLVRLHALLESMGIEHAGEIGWRAWARALDDVPGARPEPRPAPRPPVSARPRTLSVSDIGLWMTDPYDLYARRILGLSALDPLEADPGPLERGTVIHRALERFVRAFPEALPPDAERRLLDLGRQLFEDFSHRPQVMALWWPRFERIACWVIEQERARRAGAIEIKVEVKGVLELSAPAGAFRLKARADRLERHPDGRITVIDYKTGAPPDRTKVLCGLAPQLPLEAAMVQEGAFADIGPAHVAELLFWQLRGDETGGEERPAAKLEPAELAAQALEGLSRLIAHYDRLETTYRPHPRPEVPWRGDYDHLARRGEWTL
jgi:ATP-dependent helicase/nuclease subunit B